MEIERVVSGDLNKSLEQCVNALIDVERKVAQLKSELVQTIQAVSGARTQPTIAGWIGTQAPTFGAPQVQGFYGTPMAPTHAPGYAPSYAPWYAPSYAPSYAPGFGPTLAPFGLQHAPGYAYPQNAPLFVPTPSLGYPTTPHTGMSQGFLPQGLVQQGFLPQGFNGIQAPIQNHGFLW
ncbi:MAG: hypothetical protein LC624_03650 [Halobacteriales archaeon]|nr:hypothetical protein [Halobacteriales archaeon]